MFFKIKLVNKREIILKVLKKRMLSSNIAHLTIRTD